MNPSVANKNSRAFTLAELLAAGGITAILAALLLVGLTASKVSARGAQCSNNHRQMILAWSMYCHDNNDQLPVLENWVSGNMTDPDDITDTALLINPQRSALARYISVPQIYKCPGDLSRLVRSVSMNNRMNPTLPGVWLHGGGDAYAIFSKAAQIRAPSAVYATVDERSDTINDSSLCVDMSNTGNPAGIGASDPYWLIDYPASYHNASGRFSFADGHVEAHQWREPTTLLPLGQAHSAHTSATDQDTQWLQSHCTYLK